MFFTPKQEGGKTFAVPFIFPEISPLAPGGHKRAAGFKMRQEAAEIALSTVARLALSKHIFLSKRGRFY